MADSTGFLFQRGKEEVVPGRGKGAKTPLTSNPYRLPVPVSPDTLSLSFFGLCLYSPHDSLGGLCHHRSVAEAHSPHLWEPGGILGSCGERAIKNRFTFLSMAVYSGLQ